DGFVNVRRDNLTGSSGGTQTVRSCSRPSTAYSYCVTPAPWRRTQGPDSAVRASGPGAAPQTAPSFSSRRKIASPVGSLIGSLANGVRRFSRLLPAQEKAAPDAFSIVPNSGFASTFDHGNGVSWSPSRTTTYWRPSRVNPPMPFSIVRGGTGTGVDAFFGDLSVVDPGT